MSRTTHKGSSASQKTLRRIFVWTFAVMVFTGFGQMPIFKRYYLADVPGLDWTADFYLTHYIHYVGAMLLLGLIAYGIIDYLLSGRKRLSLTRSAYVRIALLSGIVFTGVLRVMKNLPDVLFAPGFTQFIDLSHLGFMMLYLFVAGFCLAFRSGWVVAKSH